MHVAVIIPAYNEESSIGMVLADIPEIDNLQVIVVDNGSTDNTREVIRDSGAELVHEPRRGYGSACLAGIEYLKQHPPDTVVFLDADYSDHPEEMMLHLDKIEQGCDLVIGSRVLGNAEPGALLPQARWGNWLAVTLIRLFYDYAFSDLGPFRAVRWPALMKMNMQDTNFGWTAEMQIKAAKMNLRVSEVPVSYRRRIGVSKVTGTVNGTIKAGYKILYTIFRSLFQ
jgi:glycosyltransferase involved in cell wall biosynthesis